MATKPQHTDEARISADFVIRINDLMYSYDWQEPTPAHVIAKDHAAQRAWDALPACEQDRRIREYYAKAREAA